MVFFKLKSNILLRDYGDFGYITDTRNFGYQYKNDRVRIVGDKIVSPVGSVFLSLLNRKPQALNLLVDKAHLQFPDIRVDILETDMKEFYEALVEDGFLAKGGTNEECENNDFRFSYFSVQNLKADKNVGEIKNNYIAETQDYFEQYFNGIPQCTNVHIEIVSLCNERCLHCYIPHEVKTGAISPDLFFDLLKQCREMRVQHVTLSGGEPMLHRNFNEFLKACKEHEFSVNILTNLTLLDDEILGEMSRNPLLGVQVSLYSMNPDIHDSITRVKGSFEKTKCGILKLIEHNIPMQISCPILKQNKDCYSDVVNWAKNLNVYAGVDYGIIAGFDHSNTNLNCRLAIDELPDVMFQLSKADSLFIEDLKKEAAKRIGITADDYICSVGHSTICVADNGKAFPCAGWQGHIIGDLNTSSLKEIWEGSKLNYLRNLRNKDFVTCTQCTDRDYCTVCMVRNANENPEGNPMVPSKYFCAITKLEKRLVQSRVENAGEI